MSASRSSAIVLVGFMGAGKSSAAKALAAETRGEAVDTDDLLEQQLGSTIADYFDHHGEQAFREHEERIVCERLERTRDGDVIALGGGAVESERVRDQLRRHTVVLLDIDADTAWHRVNGAGRPLARNRERFEQLHADRGELYLRVADAMVPGGDREHVRHAFGSIQALADAPAGTRLLWAAAESGDYPVFIGRGLLRARFWPLPGRRFCVTDENVAREWLGPFGDCEAVVAIPAGEQHKTLATAETVLRELARAGMRRDDLVAALGGGVVGDLAGFCAATYQRGVGVVQLPTTLVAQVDSAYGGKTGVDLPEAKNYVGAYHQPRAVLVDPDALATLPAAEFAAGYVELLKTALIAGGRLWRRVREAAPSEGIADDVILACARTKLAIVAADERDAGGRQALNLGHTIGHAIESATGYGRYRHGEAVGLGLLAALRLSELEPLRREVEALLAGRGLPVKLTGVDPDAVIEQARRDKKRRGEGPIPFVLLRHPGAVLIEQAVDERSLRDAVAELAE